MESMQEKSPNSPTWLNPSILRHSGIWGVANESVLNKVYYLKDIGKIFPLKTSKKILQSQQSYVVQYQHSPTQWNLRGGRWYCIE